MIKFGEELIRINSKDARHLEYSKNGGTTWLVRYNGITCGNFYDLMDNGSELLAQTEKGLYYSKNKGITWLFRHK
ncbi:MAG: hypothetical protein PHQ33_03750 [Bacteroidales bacterium]|nr:hypothetical protein [Bacteroidales bacterium]MDD4394983.1 hypothetical protein [Bacteroidales bacterium]